VHSEFILEGARQQDSVAA